jgi:hypothetical protein
VDKKTISAVMRVLGSRGGKRSMGSLTPEQRTARGVESAKNMTPAQRSARAKKAALARWGQPKKPAKP